MLKFKKSEVYELDEDEVIILIRKELDPVGYKSVVANEELGNEVLAVDVYEAGDAEIDSVQEVVDRPEYTPFMTRAYLNVLCSRGVIPAGKYLIDCTW